MEGAGCGWVWAFYGKRKRKLLSGEAEATSCFEKVLKLTIASHGAAAIELSGTQWSGEREARRAQLH